MREGKANSAHGLASSLRDPNRISSMKPHLFKGEIEALLNILALSSAGAALTTLVCVFLQELLVRGPSVACLRATPSRVGATRETGKGAGVSVVRGEQEGDAKVNFRVPPNPRKEKPPLSTQFQLR